MHEAMAVNASSAEGAPMAMGRRIHFLCQARSEAGRQAIAQAAELLHAAGAAVTLLPWPRRDQLDATIRRHAVETDLLVLGGGDGTMHTAAPALIETGVTLGILPLGTANDLARSLGIPPDPVDAARVLLEGERRQIDLGEVNGRPFFNVASIGLSVEVTRELTGDLKRRWGRLAYAIASWRALPRARPFSAEIICDGQVHKVRTLQVAIGNGRHYGGGMVVEEGAAFNDGVLHLYSLEFERALWLALLIPAMRKGRQGKWRQVRTASCTEAEIRTRRPRTINADGELVSRTPARLRILRKAVAVMVPRETPEG
jgi:YegS/Rv2252/BmrU family lipid kinase